MSETITKPVAKAKSKSKSKAKPKTNRPWRRWVRFCVNAILCVAILVGTGYTIHWINSTEPIAEKINTTRKSAALVDTVKVKRGKYSPAITVLGTVRPAQQISLRPRVNGQVVELSSKFIPGGMVKKNDLLLRIDPADFENAVSIRKSEVDQANARMEIEEARQRLAEKELELLNDSIDNANRGLVMREPQIASIKAEVAAAEAAVERAKLDLERTKIVAPFDAQVLSRSVNIGSQVGGANELGRLVGLDEYWVMAAVPIRSLRWIEFPKEGDETESDEIEGDEIEGEEGNGKGGVEKGGSEVTLRNPDAWGEGVVRKGRVARLIGSLDETTRLARVLVVVDDPLGKANDAPTLILDSLLETEIQGKAMASVVRLDREYIRGEEKVWVRKDGKLEIRDVEIEFRDGEFVYVSSGLDDGDEVVTSTLATPAEGIGLKERKLSK